MYHCKKINWVLGFLALLAGSRSIAQQPGAPIDVLHYEFTVTLSDLTDRVEGTATIRYKALAPATRIALNLACTNTRGKGMKVISIMENQPLRYEHKNDTLYLSLAKTLQPDSVQEVTIRYGGIPADGLIIGKNKYQHRVFFADHWPNRAHHWLPCVDHPADKATVNFTIIAPQRYQVIANGTLRETTSLQNGNTLHRYTENRPLPTKVMVIGAAEFAVELAGRVNQIPVYSWVYPRDKEKGFYDYAQALEVLPFYMSFAGPYAYEKLANVQSKTRFGGLENANTIFYSENSITGNRQNTALIAHEIAHQWFGNMVTETDWSHVWLSEGFATFLTNEYMAYRFGKDTLMTLLKQDREQVIRFSKTNNRPVVDTAVTDYMQLLNANSYQKGGWILRMLQQQLGDSLFGLSLRAFYKKYAGGNASTADLQAVFESMTQKKLDVFFRQWLYLAGHPRLHISWTYDDAKKLALVTVEQTQPVLFDFPLKLHFEGEVPGASQTHTVHLDQRKTFLDIPLANRPEQLVVDPDMQLLAEWTLQQIFR